MIRKHIKVEPARWYELCDEYGIYVVAEANQESHGFQYGDGSIGCQTKLAGKVIRQLQGVD